MEGPYALFATDVPEEMALVYAVDRGAYVERVPPTVFAAGWDARHIVVKRHPAGDRKRTEIFVLDRRRDGPLAEPAECIAGPMTEAEFAVRRAGLGVGPGLAFRVTLSELQ